jgi:hypothetical protein
MQGYVTWIGIGITGFIAGYEAVIASNPELAAILVGSGTIVVGIARKIEKVLHTLEK